MKKWYLLLILVLVCIFKSLGQEYSIEITDYNFQAWTNNSRCGTNELWLEVVLSDNSKKRLHSEYPHSHNLSKPINRTFTKEIKKIVFHTFIHEKGGFPPNCNGDTSHIDITKNINSVCDTGTISGSHHGGQASTQISFKYKIKPVITLAKTSQNTISKTESFNITSQTGFPTIVYNWEYQIDPNLSTWTTINGASGSSSLTLKPIDFLDNPSSSIGKNIRFRIQTCNGEYSNIVSYTIVPVAPVLTSLSAQKTSCSYTNDGSVYLKFQSQLEAGEQLILSLFQGNNLLYNESTTLLDRALGYQWQTNLEAGTYQIKYQVKKNGVNSALVSIPSFTINNPAPIQVSNIQTKGVSCFQGSDGHIEMTITGEPGRSFAYYVEREANGVYSKYRDTTAFRNTKRIENLEKGKYRFIVKDTGNCFAKETDGQTNTVFEAIIATPEHELRLDYPVQAQILPSFHGATNGALKAVIIGGTPKADGTYNFVWKNSLGENMSSNITTKVFGDRFEIDLKNIGSDTYTLTVTDANFNATNSMQQHCTVSNSAYFLNQPNPLTLALTENNPISCNNTNDKLNPFSDGVLKAHADGGVKLKPSQNAGLSYYYTWKKWVNGVWKILPQYTSNIAADLDVGRYAVNIEDANGIVIGVYVNNLLSEAKDVIYDLKQPDLLEVSLRSTPMSCNYNKDGSVIATVTGGTGKYTYNWSNGATSPTISHLSSGTYFVYVKDEKGCEASASIQVSKPNEIVVSTLKKLPPTCYNGTDGEIEIGVAGGNPPYQIKWKNGNTDKKRTQLTAGIYQVEVSDSKGCLEIVEIELVDPDPILVSLGEDRTLCSDQSLQFDVSIADAAAQYKWTSDTGFSSESAKITIKESGNYTVTVTTSQGCKATDSIQVSSKSTEIDAQFLLSSQAFAKEEILIVNTSVPVGDKTDWTYPVQAELIEKTDRYLQLKFDEPGAYEVALRAYQGDCYLDYKKTIIVEKARTLYGLGDPELPFIKDFRVYPNPSSGAFKAHIQLSEPAFISLRLFSMLSNIPINDQSPSSDSVYTIEYNENMPAGLYFLLLETPKGNQIRKVVIE